jgi:hypothetical protein
VGFYSVAYATRNADATWGNQNGSYNFTGLNISSATGTVTLYANGVAGSAIAYTGTFSPAVPFTVSYQVDTTTGAISNVSIPGSSSSYVFTTSAFTDAATAYAGFGMQGGTTAQGNVDNFSVSTVPEPATVALLALGGLMMLPRRRQA